MSLKYEDLQKMYEECAKGGMAEPQSMGSTVGAIRYLVNEKLGRENVREDILSLVDSDWPDGRYVMIYGDLLKLVEETDNDQ